MGHHTHHLLPGSLAGRSEVLADVGGQDDDQDVPQELAKEEEEKPSGTAVPSSFIPRSHPRAVMEIHHDARSPFPAAHALFLALWHSLGCWNML